MATNRRQKGSANRAAALLLAMPLAAWCQAPVISNIVNSASYQPTWGASGSIATIFGTNLASTIAYAPGVPLPFELGGTTVTVLGNAVALFYVSPAQINFQVPEGGLFAVVVTTGAGSSIPAEPGEEAWYAAGIFTMDASGCGQGAVLNVAADGDLSLNSASNSASPGDWLSVYSTGVSQIYTAGAAAPLLPLAAPDQPSVEFDFGGEAQAVLAGWTGLAPGFVGLDQINVQLPASVREGCAVPLQIEYSTLSAATSAPVTIAVHNGGGPCVDPPAAGFGQIIWQKTITTAASNSTTESDMLTASLQSSPGKEAPPLPAYTDNCAPPGDICNISLPNFETLFGPACPVPGYRSLAAGALTIQGPGLAAEQVPLLPFTQGSVGGLNVYQIALPSGAIAAGTYIVTASGGADVGPFQESLEIGADIQIQTPLSGANVFAACKPFTINWTGGDPKSWVTVSFLYQATAVEGGWQGDNIGMYQTRTANGTLTIPALTFDGMTCAAESTTRQLVIEVDPDPSEFGTFSPTGLSLGGRATWSYVHTFPVTVWVPG